MEFVRVLTVADIHQAKPLYDQLLAAVQYRRPHLVAFVGDFLNAFDMDGSPKQFSIDEFTVRLSQLPVEHLLFVRGNHEDQNWVNFANSWPFANRPLIALYGTAFKVGALAIIGFPCHTGGEESWCVTLPKKGNEIVLNANNLGRKSLPIEMDKWLPELMRSLGPEGRHLWLLHEPPMQYPLGGAMTWNPQWKEAIERFSPLITVSGHDHTAPLKNKQWHASLEGSVCINVGQREKVLHYCILEYEFQTGHSLPSRLCVKAYPWGSTIEIKSHSQSEP